MAVLEISNLTKTYHGQHAVNNMSLNVQKGDIYGLIGQNGAGKTTLMRMITGLAQPTSGSITLFGESYGRGLQHARSRMGAIIEMPALYPNLTAHQNLEYYRIQRGIPDKRIIESALAAVGLADTGRKQFKDFSLGMKQRLGLALATLNSPDFIILDEPINGLDPMGIVEVRNMIQSLSSQGITILLSSHILSELALVANKFAFMHKGQLVKSITQSQLQEECKQALSIIVDDTPKAAAILETVLGINNYKQIGINELRVYEQINNASEITHQLAKEGVRISQMHEVGDSLEEYFTNIIGGAGK